MILSTLFSLLKLTKRKPIIFNTLITSDEKENPLSSSQRMIINPKENDHAKQGKEDHHDLEESEVLELEDFPSESEASEYDDAFELKWNTSSSTNDDVAHKVPIYASYFSEEDEDGDEDYDEDNLIEISLPGSESEAEDYSMLDQKGLLFMEVLGEMNNEINEEDNLIEIDISVGSIKCPRFDIET